MGFDLGQIFGILVIIFLVIFFIKVRLQSYREEKELERMLKGDK